MESGVQCAQQDGMQMQGEWFVPSWAMILTLSFFPLTLEEGKCLFPHICIFITPNQTILTNSQAI